MNDTEYQKLLRKIAEKSEYGRKESCERTTMSVPEMRKLLGVKKTESYWIIHQNYFKTDVVGGRMRIDLASFEKWYANQVKHRKITGEEPGQELRTWSYSAREMAEVLGVEESVIYEIWKRDKLEIFCVDYVKRISIQEFERWYANQNRYQKREKISDTRILEEDYICSKEAARLLGITRSHLGLLLYRGVYREYFELVTYCNEVWISKESFQCFLSIQSRYKLADDPKDVSKHEEELLAQNEYLTRKEAAAIAQVTPATITKWIQKGYFNSNAMGRILRIKRSDFMEWLEAYRKESKNGIDQTTE